MNLDQWLGKENKVGQDIWKNKYQYNNETLDEWFDRISNKNEEVKRLMKEKKFLFGGRVLAARNIDSNLSYSNCYVIKAPEDNLEDINRCCGEMARTYSYGGGCGIDISNLRPRGTAVNNAAKISSGSVSFMNLFSEVTSTIAQSGRRGALMICLDCDHPDIEEFITIKSDLTKVNKANISVKMSDEFMQAVLDNAEINLKYNDKIFKKINAKELFLKFSEMNWDFAEPGCLFWDRITKYNFLDCVKEFQFDSCNPCA